MKEQIIEWCTQLATSQGFYGRLLNEFKENPKTLDDLSERYFSYIVDFIMFVES